MVKVAFMQLSSCWGCHQSLLNAHLGLLAVLPHLEIVYWPAVVDFKLDSLKERPDGDIVVGFLEGCIRTEADRENTLLMRKKCAIIVAWGACSIHGGIPGMANLSTKKECLETKFINAPSLKEGQIPSEYITPITDRVYSVTETIPCQVLLPGCPPTTENIVASVLYLLTMGAEPANKNAGASVCETCKASPCLLDKGEVCFGPVTAAGCSLMCPNDGDPCVGCYKATTNLGQGANKIIEIINSKSSLDMATAVDMKKFMSLFNGLANFDYMYFKGDPLQVLAKDKQIMAVNTGNGTIDNLLGTILTKLRDSPEFKFSQKTVCSTCNRKIVDKVFTAIKRDYEGLPNEDQCLLEQGYICCGPATKAGCGTLCVNNANAPCLGCYGPPEDVKDQGAQMLSTYCSLAQTTPEDLKAKILDPAGLFNRFTLASSTLGKTVRED
ncbi:MAG: hypothetical protein GY870_20355 [archaeon]|nr:hypothetical protein [archaeon]